MFIKEGLLGRELQTGDILEQVEHPLNLAIYKIQHLLHCRPSVSMR